MNKVSVITVCYNAEQTIKRTIESIFEQSYSDYEYVVIDGASKDDTLQIINSYVECFAHKGILMTVIE